MKNIFSHVAAIVLSMAGLFAGHAAYAIEIDNVYFFGASLTDQGNNAGNIFDVYSKPLANDLGFIPVIFENSCNVKKLGSYFIHGCIYFNSGGETRLRVAA